LQSVYRRFGIDPGSIGLIEAHGTGTKLGDPIEVAALKAAFAPFTQRAGYCALGSVKSNIGHCLTAAGAAGTIKLALALRHRQLPPSANFRQRNEHIRLDGSPFFVSERLREWDTAADAPRRGAVSSFGFSG
ncbi:polyketide synthase, partial [Streptomyces sp. S12]|nr:polyketide synthase [Streptomyces sp. S12]